MIIMKNVLILALFSVIFISGCIQEQEPVFFVKIPGHPESYQFSYNIRDTVNIESTYPQEVRNMILQSDRIVFVINATESETSPGHYSVAATNIIQKLKSYQLYNGKLINEYATYIYDNQETMWLNESGEIQPDFTGAALWLEIGSDKTSVDAENDKIYVRGISPEDMVKAADKLALIFMNIDKTTLN